MRLINLGGMATLLLALLLPPSADAIIFSTLPANGQISALPGELAGWGYTLGNTDSVNWFVPTALSASSMNLGTPDASYFDFPILEPGQTVSMAFDAGSLSGLYGVQVHSFATPGQSESGAFLLAGEWWSSDPFDGGVFIGVADPISTPYLLQVGGVTAVPTAGTVALFGPGLLLMLLLDQRRRKKAGQVGASLR